MANKTPIEWTDETWNPLKGCLRISPGCGGAHNGGGCYAERQAIRQSGPSGAYEGLVKSTPNGPRWTGAVAVDEEKLLEPLRWKKPRTVFVDSMSDLFFEGFPDEQVARAVATMARTPHITYQVLTKRAGRMEKLLGAAAFWEEVRGWATGSGLFRAQVGLVDLPRPLPNVWWGVSCEDRKHGLPRLHHLRRTLAAVRFVSYEPLLEDVTEPFPDDDVDPLGGPDEHGGCRTCGLSWEGEKGSDGHHECPPGFGGRIHWAIIGGESGPRSRPCDVAWIRALLARCRAAGVAPFVKQLGAHPHVGGAGAGPAWHITGEGKRRRHWRMDDPTTDQLIVYELHHHKAGDPAEWPEDLRVREMPEVPGGR